MADSFVVALGKCSSDALTDSARAKTAAGSMRQLLSAGGGMHAAFVNHVTGPGLSGGEGIPLADRDRLNIQGWPQAQVKLVLEALAQFFDRRGAGEEHLVTRFTRTVGAPCSVRITLTDPGYLDIEFVGPSGTNT